MAENVTSPSRDGLPEIPRQASLARVMGEVVVVTACLLVLWAFFNARVMTSAPGQQVVISEFLALNGDPSSAGRDGALHDWIELTNVSHEKVDLKGWYLTDDYRDHLKWCFPSIRLAAGERLRVYASGRDVREARSGLHTNFRLDHHGEYLALLRPDGSVEHHYALRFPPQFRNVSYGLPESGETAAPAYFGTPTPGEPNRDSVNGILPAVVFSAARGFYGRSFELELRSPESGVEIRYTTDGTAPAKANGRVYAEPLSIDGTTVVRAAAFRSGMGPSSIATHTFLFPGDIIHQSSDGVAPPGFPHTWGHNMVDYGMDPDIVNDPRYGPLMRDALLAIPTFSVVMNSDDLFDDERGIYANARQDGRAWERLCSVELIHSDDRPGFHIDGGIRVRGGFSRTSRNPKHAFRLFFREQYGAAPLEFPLFGEEGASTFDNVDLRTFQNYSWSFQGDPRGVFLRDQFSRDTQADMGHPSARGNFVHLYLNGQYWGLYNTCERPEASYGRSYFGGKSEDYDVVKILGRRSGGGLSGYSVFATDGNLTAWENLWRSARAGLADDAAYRRLLGQRRDGSRDARYPRLLAPVNLIDYMLTILYAGNLDAPVSAFSGNRRPNNWYGIRDRGGGEGFRFFAWDAEHTLLELSVDRTGPFSAGDEFGASNPQWLWQQCLENADFRMLVADRVFVHCFNGGSLTPEAAVRRFLRRKEEIELPVVAESARWGDAALGGSFGFGRRRRFEATGPLNRDDHWLPEIERLVTGYFPYRTDVVVHQLWRKGLFPDVAAPRMHWQKVASGGETLTLEADEGSIYFTRDGSDPRLPGGGISLSAERYDNPILTDPASPPVRARVLREEEWSPLATFDGNAGVSSAGDGSQPGTVLSWIAEERAAYLKEYDQDDDGKLNGRERETLRKRQNERAARESWRGWGGRGERRGRGRRRGN